MSIEPVTVLEGQGWFVRELTLDGATQSPAFVELDGCDVVTVQVDNQGTALSTGCLELKKSLSTRTGAEWSFSSAQELSAAGQLTDVDVHDAAVLVVRMKTVQSGVRLLVRVYGRRSLRVTIDDADTRLLTLIDQAPRGFIRPQIDVEQYDAGAGGYLAMTDNRGYFCYLGRLARAISSAQVQVGIQTGATGGGTSGEAGLFSSASPPNATAQTLTKLGSASITLTGTGSTLSSAIAASVPAGTHLWAALRGTGWATAPDVMQVGYDLGQGRVLYKSSVGAFSGLTSTSTTLPSFASYGLTPYLSAYVG